MAVFNGEKYLRQAIASILTQTFGDFELLIVDDGSTDRTGEIVRSYRDPRLRLIENGRNLGLSRSLNSAIAQARGRYIARLDADDVAEPARFEQQVRFLERHGDVAVVGCQYHIIAADGRITGHRRVPCSDIEIRWMLDFCTPFAHSSVMMRRQALQQEPGPYDESLFYAMDYDLWIRLAERGRLANLGDVLLRWRMTPDSMTARLGDRTERLDRVVKVMANRLGWPGDDVVENERRGDLLCSIIAGATPDAAIGDAEAANRTLFALHADFCRRHQLDAETARSLRETLRRHTARVLLWMGHQYPDRRGRAEARRALAAAVRQRPASLLSRNALGLLVKILGGRFTVSRLRRVGNRSATATR
jgi:glycosyltransferase involved in cell wall biosynthesis